jgi:hypothetical protein
MLSAVEFLAGQQITRLAGPQGRWLHGNERSWRPDWVIGSITARTWRWLAITQAVLATLSIIMPTPLRSAGLLIVSATAWLLVKQLPWGEDAADQMARMLLIGGATAYAIGSPRAQVLFLWFAAIQLCVAYLSAGISKLSATAWRRGDALIGILSTDAFGRRCWTEALLTRRSIVRCAAWSTICFECAFPLAFASSTLLTLLLLVGVAFHVGVAAIMRLNTFLFAFLAAYPAVIYCAASIR